MNTLGQRIAYYRKAANLTQPELVRVEGADGSTVISRCEPPAAQLVGGEEFYTKYCVHFVF